MMFALSGLVQAQFTFTTNNGAITLSVLLSVIAAPVVYYTLRAAKKNLPPDPDSTR
jgi:hypothetical protein